MMYFHSDWIIYSVLFHNSSNSSYFLFTTQYSFVALPLRFSKGGRRLIHSGRLIHYTLRYYDKRNSKYIVNVFKFSTTFPIVIFAAILSLKLPVTESLTDLNFAENGWVFGGWALFSFINGLFSFLWVVRHDWGLPQLSKGTLLRPKRLYRWTGLYCTAIFHDLVLQFTWTINLTLGILWRLNSDVIFTGLVFCEIVRLFAWNLLRVEYRHVQRMTRLNTDQ